MEMSDLIAALSLLSPSFLLASLVVIVAPGPALFYIIGSSIGRGFSQGLVAAAGVALGAAPHVFAATLGLAAVLERYPTAFDFIRCAGGVFLIYLGISILRGAIATSDERVQKVEGRIDKTFFAGFLISVAGPHLTFFFLSFFPNFIDPTGARGTEALALLGGAFLLIAFLIFSLISFIASQACRYLQIDPIVRLTAGAVGAVLFISIGVDAISNGVLRDAGALILSL